MMLLLVMLLFKSLPVCAAAGLLLPALRRSSAAARHLVCLGALAALLALPLFSLALPGWHLPMIFAAPPLVKPVAATEFPSAPNTEGAEKAVAEQNAGAAAGIGAASALVVPAPPALGTRRTSFPWPLVGIAFYAAGVALASVRPLLGLWGIRRLRRGCGAVTDAPTLAAAADCARLLGMSPPCLYRADVPVPMTWGWRQPVVVLPESAAGWPESRLRSVLLHELAHVKRRDWPGHRIADLACAIYWFHPLVWLIARRLRAESEAACDDLVLASGVAAPDYARHLLAIAQTLPPAARSPHSAIAMAQTSRIERRLLMLLDTTQSRRALTRRVLLAALVPSAAALVTLAVLRPDAKAQAVPNAAKMSPTATDLTSGVIHTTFTTLKMTVDASGKKSYTFSPDLKIDGTTLFAGITNTDKLTSPWWSATGALLPTPVYDKSLNPSRWAGEPNAQNLELAFRLPPAAQGVTVRFKLPQSTFDSSVGEWPGKLQLDAGQTESQMFASTGGARIVSAAFPPTLKKTSMQIGIASGAWKTAASEARSSGTAAAFEETGTTRTGNQSFILGEPVQAAKDITLTVSDTAKDDIRVVALDMQGNILFPTTVGGQSVSNLDQITAHFSQPLSQIKAFRVQTRPFQWIEFKDVALKPVQSAGKV